jgi:drug/metabolite transporter (DMT)-like permease
MIVPAGLTSFGLSFELFSLYKIPLSVFAILQFSNMIFVPIFGYFLLNRKPYRYCVLGYFIVICLVMFYEILNRLNFIKNPKKNYLKLFHK